jgi:hypothetical protein
MSKRGQWVAVTQGGRVGEAGQRGGFASRHADLAYVFGPTVRAFFVLGCLAVDLLTPLQVLASRPEDLGVVPLLFATLTGLVYLEYRLYRRIRPSPRKRESACVPGAKQP